MVSDDIQKLHIVMDAYSAVFPGIALGDFKRAILAAVVDDQIIKVRVGLAKDAFDTLFQILFAVINRRYYTNEGLIIDGHFLRCFSLASLALPESTFAFHLLGILMFTERQCLVNNCCWACREASKSVWKSPVDTKLCVW